MDPLAPIDFLSFDQTRLTFYRDDPADGVGRPVVLLHGLFSSAHMNWVKWGHSQLLAEAGFTSYALDFRVHGASEAPQDASAYPPGVLVRDAASFIETLGLGEGEYDLVGFSLGARTALHAVAQGALHLRRLAACGMGLEGLSDWQRRADHFKRVIDEFDTIKPGSPLYVARTFLKSQGVDRVAARPAYGRIDPR